MFKPLVSVIIPVYNVEKFICNCILSIIAQTYDKIELILVDDGCTDDSILIAEEYLANYEKKYIIIRQNNLGQSKARNNGVAHSTGEYFICPDADDILHPYAIEYLVKSCLQFNGDVAFCDYTAVLSGDKYHFDFKTFKIGLLESQQALTGFLLRKYIVLAPALLIKKELIEKNSLKYIEDCRYSEDQIYIWQLLSISKRIVHVKFPLYHYIVRQNSIMTSSSFNNMLTGYAAITKMAEENKSFRDFGLTSYIISRWVFGTLRIGTRLAKDYNEFKALADRLEAKKHAENLYHFPDIKINILAGMVKIHYLVYYFFVRLIDKTGV